MPMLSQYSKQEDLQAINEIIELTVCCMNRCCDKHFNPFIKWCLFKKPLWFPQSMRL